MFSLFMPPKPAQERLDWALKRPKDANNFNPQRIRARSADDHLYFAVRSVAATGAQHLLQYAFADDNGNVVMSLMAEAPRPMPVELHEPAAMAVEPMAPEALEYMLSCIMDGANLVAFGKVLQAGMLPSGLVQRAASVECAWRRYLSVCRQRRGAFDRHQPVTLSDALLAAGLPAPESEDAAVRALAVRDLWRWMDRVELGRQRGFMSGFGAGLGGGGGLGGFGQAARIGAPAQG
jgi:hypothetical protein